MLLPLTESGFPDTIRLMSCVYIVSKNRSPFLHSGEGGRGFSEPQEKMNRKHLIPGLILALALLLLCVSFALAADDPLKVSMELSTNRFTEPKEITVSISVSNVGESDLPGPVTLYYPSGKQVEEFGSPTLTVGTSKSWTGPWKVTQKELEAGRITFKLKYSLYNDEGTLVNKTKNFSLRLIYTGAEPELTINRTIRPMTAQKGQEVTVTYEIENTGDADVTGVTIKENNAVSQKTGTIDAIAAGEKASYTFTATMGSRDITSSATVSYKSGGKSYSQKVEAAVIKYGEVKLTASVTADKKGGAPGDTVKLTLKLRNSGTVDFTNVTITDDNLGEVFKDLTVKAKETVTLTHDMTITETQDVQFTVNAEDATGVPVETATGKVNVIATDPTQQIVLSVHAEADRNAVYQIPGNVQFTITVTNESAVDVKNITVKAVDTTINTYDLIEAGDSRTFTRTMAVSMAGTYQFTATCRDQLDQQLSFGSNMLLISLEQPTAEPTEAPIVTPPAPQYEEVPETYEDLDPARKLPGWVDQVESIADQIKWILAGVVAVLVILLLIGAIRRGAQKRHSNQAMDHLEGANYRDYSTEPKRNKRSVISGKDPVEKKAAEEEQTENTAQDSELMAETLQRLYKDSAPAEGGAEGEAADAAQEGGHRRRNK